MVACEKAEEPILDGQLTPNLQQLSATLQARLISLMAKEAFSIVNAASKPDDNWVKASTLRRMPALLYFSFS